MVTELIASILCCVGGVWMITMVTRFLETLPADAPKDRLLHFLAALWLTLMAVFLISVLASELEAFSGN